MASAKIQCPKCHRQYNVAEKILGRKVTCANSACTEKFIAEIELPRFDEDEIIFLPEETAALASDPYVNSISPRFSRSIVKSRLIQTGAIAIAIALLSGIGLMIYFSGPKGSKSAGSGTIERDTKIGKVTELLEATETTIRLLKISDDEKLAHDYLDKWVALRGQIPKSDDIDVSLDVIEGHLTRIHQTVYPRKFDWSEHTYTGWHNGLEWAEHHRSTDAIKAAQSQLMKQLQIPWKDVQQASLYPVAFGKLRDEGRRISAMSKIGTNNLPDPLSSDDAIRLIHNLDILFADVPFVVHDAFGAKRITDDYAVPVLLEHSEDDTKAMRIHALSESIIRARSHLPPMRTLEEKSEAIEFIKDYNSSLESLNKAVR